MAAIALGLAAGGAALGQTPTVGPRLVGITGDPQDSNDEVYEPAIAGNEDIAIALTSATYGSQQRIYYNVYDISQGQWTQEGVIYESGDPTTLVDVSIAAAANGDFFGCAKTGNKVWGSRYDSQSGTWGDWTTILDINPHLVDIPWVVAGEVIEGEQEYYVLFIKNGAEVLGSFGHSVAIDGERILVGAYAASSFSSGGGAAYVYERTEGAMWIETAEFVNDDNWNGHSFGTSVALDGDLAVVGAMPSTPYGSANGAAYVFHCDGPGVWRQVAKLVADDGFAWQRLGWSAALDGNIAVVGTKPDDEQTTDPGAAYVFMVSDDADRDGLMDVCECPADVDRDGAVDLTDLSLLLAHFGESGLPGEPNCPGAWGTWCAGDLNGDRDVDLADLSHLLVEYGTSCE